MKALKPFATKMIHCANNTRKESCSGTQVKYVQVYGMDIKRTSSFNFFHGLDVFSTHNFAFMNKYKCIVQILLMLGKVGNRTGQSHIAVYLIFIA